MAWPKWGGASARAGAMALRAMTLSTAEAGGPGAACGDGELGRTTTDDLMLFQHTSWRPVGCIVPPTFAAHLGRFFV